MGDRSWRGRGQSMVELALLRPVLTPYADIVSAVDSQTLFLGPIPSSDIVVTPARSQRASGNSVTVSLTYRFQPMTPVISTLVGPSITMRASRMHDSSTTARDKTAN